MIAELDLSGLNCPLPLLKTKKFLANLESGTKLKVITTDPAAKNDLAQFCSKTGNILDQQETNAEKVISYIIKR